MSLLALKMLMEYLADTSTLVYWWPIPIKNDFVMYVNHIFFFNDDVKARLNFFFQ